MGELRKTLGKNLKKLRGDLPQTKFAKILGISKSSLNRIEIGDQNVAIDTIEVICKKLKLNIGSLFGHED